MQILAERFGKRAPSLALCLSLSSIVSSPASGAWAFAPTPSFAGRRVDNSCLRSSPSADAAAVAAPEGTVSAAPTTSTFTSPTFRVYIEDTDAYGVIYNGNYLRSYERALSHVVREEEEQQGRWILSHITDHKFRSSPALGEEYVVRGELIGNGDNDATGDGGTDVEVWQLEMATQNDEDKEEWTVHNSATATLTRSSAKSMTETTAAQTIPSTTRSSDDVAELGKRFESRYTPYRDEFDTHPHCDPARGYHIPIRSALNFFERSRSNILGGPDELRRMQVEDDILWVVTGIDDGELHLDPPGGAATIDWHPAPGREVMVQTNFVVKRRGMIIDCEHGLFTEVELDGKTNRRLLARATVTIMALKGSTHRPTSKLPQWFLDKSV